MSGAFDHYEGLDEMYRLIWGGHLHHRYWGKDRSSWESAERAMAEHILAHVPAAAKGPWLDVGCGNGDLTAALAAKLGATVTGLTISPAQAARANRLPQVQARCGDWMEANFPRSSFAGILTVECLEHIRDRQRAVARMAQVLEQGGWLVVAGYGWAKNARGVQQAQKFRALRESGCLEGLGEIDETTRVIHRAGLRLVSHVDISREVAPTWSRALLRLGRPSGPWWQLAKVGSRLGWGKMAQLGIAACQFAIAYASGGMCYQIWVARKETAGTW